MTWVCNETGDQPEAHFASRKAFLKNLLTTKQIADAGGDEKNTKGVVPPIVAKWKT